MQSRRVDEALFGDLRERGLHERSVGKQNDKESLSFFNIIVLPGAELVYKTGHIAVGIVVE